MSCRRACLFRDNLSILSSSLTRYAVLGLALDKHGVLSCEVCGKAFSSGDLKQAGWFQLRLLHLVSLLHGSAVTALSGATSMKFMVCLLQFLLCEQNALNRSQPMGYHDRSHLDIILRSVCQCLSGAIDC